jgi:outer membrane protein assembly factor BamD
MIKRAYILLIFSLLLASCSDFNKIVKSTDYEYKYKKALEFYEAKNYSKANTLFQDLVYVFRGTSRGDELYYFYAKSSYEDADYTMAGHYFKTLTEQYPRSKYAEESQYMTAMCFYMESPSPKLDQEVTKKAIDAFTLFINLYPFSNRVEQATIHIDEMHNKLVMKSFTNAKLYFDMGYYKAANVALENSLKEFPDSKYREDIKYLMFKSKFLIGMNSVSEKKRERLYDARDEYFNFVDEFPQSKFLREVKRDFKQISNQLGDDDADADSESKTSMK